LLALAHKTGGSPHKHAGQKTDVWAKDRQTVS
jgi:hypothetical protein